jgi:hypothetical protein
MWVRRYIIILVDIHEPINIILLLKQSVEVSKGSFNQMGLPDYSWIAGDGLTDGISRKQAGEVLGDLDGTEVQLRKDMEHTRRLALLIENPFSPCVHNNKPGTVVWIPAKDGKLLRQGHKFGTPYSRVYSWLDKLDKSGITIVQTFNWECSAMVIPLLYKNSCDPESTVLNRYIKRRVRLEERNRHVETLMGVSGVNIGEVKAKALVDMFGTAWNVFSRDPDELTMVNGIGPTLADKFLWAIGR